MPYTKDDLTRTGAAARSVADAHAYLEEAIDELKQCRADLPCRDDLIAKTREALTLVRNLKLEAAGLATMAQAGAVM